MSGISITGTATVPIAALRPYPRNPRAGDIEAITESVRQHGIYRHLVVNSRDNTVLAGNHLLHAAHEAGLTEVPVSYVDVDDEEAARIVLVDNRASQLGGMDEGLLASLLSDLPDLSGTLYTQTDLDDLLARVNAEPTPLPTFKELDESIEDGLPTEMCRQCGRLCVREQSAPEPTH